LAHNSDSTCLSISARKICGSQKFRPRRFGCGIQSLPDLVRTVTCHRRTGRACSRDAPCSQIDTLVRSLPDAFSLRRHPRESRSATAARHRSPEWPAPESGRGRSCLLDRTPAGLDRLVRLPGDRETCHRRRLAPTNLSRVLASPLPQTGTAPNRRKAARSDCSHGEGEPVGSTKDPRRTAQARLSGLRTHGVAVHAGLSAAPASRHLVDDVPDQPPRRARGHGFLHRPDGDLPAPLCALRNPAPSSQDRARQRHAAPDSRMGSPTTPRGVPVRPTAAVSIDGPRFDLLGTGGPSGDRHADPAATDECSESLAEWGGRALGGDLSAGAARSCHRVRRRPPAAPAL